MKEEKRMSKVIQTTLDEFIDSLTDNSFLYHFISFCEQTFGNIASKNRYAVISLGCSLINIANRAYIHLPQPMPANMFIVLKGRPAAGKSTLLQAVNLVIDPTWIDVIPTGSAEAIEQEILLRRFGYLFWDEMGELASKSSEYLERVKYVLNRAYYLARITRSKTTKKTIDIPANSYYLNAVLAGLPEDWVKIEKKFLGGFERRFLPISVRRARRPFEFNEPTEEAKKHLEWMWNYINERKDKVVLVKVPDLSFMREKVEEVDDKYSTLVEEYLLKFTVAYSLDKSGVLSNYQQLSQGIYNSLIVNDSRGVLLIDVDSDRKNTPSPSRFQLTINALFDRMIEDIIRKIEVSDSHLYLILQRIHEYLHGGNPPILRKWHFMRDVLKITNAQYFSYVVKALVESGHIRIIRQSERSQWVVLDPQARCCCNCIHWDQKHNVCKLELPTDASAAAFAKPINPEELVEEAKKCDDFTLAEQ